MLTSDSVRLRHMLDAAREAVSFASGRDPKTLSRDRMLMLAVVRCIEIIGEAATRISPELRLRCPQIPWTDIVGMRNRLIHAYFEIDTDLVCDTLVGDLPRAI
jgi:uncharacterized protein with HEPN domain